MAIKGMKATIRSTRLAATAPAGTNSRGKYILVIKWALPTMLLLLVVTALAKNVHGTSTGRAKKGYGKLVETKIPSRPKKSEKTTIISTGWRIAQAAPSRVCLYFTLTSRQVRK